MTQASPQRDHILIVEDDRQTGKSLALLLAASGYDEIRVVRSAARALAIAATFHPAITFVGTPMPEGDVKELGMQLQKHAKPHGMRLIALIDSVEHPTKEVARAAGLERYLSKPVTADDLDRALRKLPGA